MIWKISYQILKKCDFKIFFVHASSLYIIIILIIFMLIEDVFLLPTKSQFHTE